jgi:aquaporin Z
VVTSPGSYRVALAFVAEIVITFMFMTAISHVSNSARAHKFTGLCAGFLVATYISVEAPISGMSVNPARTFASAVPAHYWTACRIYFTAPLVGMLSAAEAYVRTRGAAQRRLYQASPRQQQALHLLPQAVSLSEVKVA